MGHDEAPRLRRDIGPLGSALLSFNGIVGAGIFALPAVLHLQFGTFSPWLFPVFGLLMLLVAVPFARLATLFPDTGGPVAYAATFGPFAAMQVGWLYYLARTTAFAANANVFATYAGALAPPLDTGPGRAGLIVALTGLITWVNIVGVRRAIGLLDLLSFAKVVPLLLLVGWALAVAADNVPAPAPLPPLQEVEAAALLILYAFIGFENSVVPAGETRAPRRTIPRALVVTIAATAALYFLVQLAYVAIMPVDVQPDAPLAAFAAALIGPVGFVLLGATAMASVAGNALSSLTSTPRVTFALAGRGLLPRWFGAISPRWRTPANSVLFMGLAGGALALSGSFVWLAIVSTLARLAVYAVCIAALPVAQRRAASPLGAGRLVSIGAALLVCGWAAAQSTSTAWTMLAGLLLIGLLLYALARRQAGSSSAGTVESIQPPPSMREP